jgi:two-component system cell cycle response regulator DivK
MRALVVEDNPVNMKLITKVLKKRRYEAIHAVCGEDGVEKAKSEHPDIILMDILLPDRKKINGAGCNGYFEKPIDPLTIMDEIEKII